MGPRTFVFDRYDFDEVALKANFYYKTDADHQFCESLTFQMPTTVDYSAQALKQALKFYWLLAGTSYYKAHMAFNVELNKETVDSWQAEQLSNIYKHGLGELLYVNQLDPDSVASFYGFSDSREQVVAKTVHNQLALVPIGGGKDSLVSVSELQAKSQSLVTFRINPQAWIKAQLNHIGVPQVIVTRQLDPFLLSGQEQLKGHIPVTLVVSSAAVIAAILGGYGEVVLSNAASADEPTIKDYKGMPINHQWAKSSVAEVIFKEWVRRYVSQDIKFYSALRGMNELDIAETFARDVWPTYRGQWSSSNSNFVYGQDKPISWDLTSAKTCTVFALLAPFIPREELIKEFGGNPFTLEQNKPTWQKLLGKTEAKPFECVASIEEMNQAINLAHQSGNWPETTQLISD